MSELNDLMISIENGKILHKDNLVLNHVNVKVKRGEFVYLIGKTGTGKSSLLKVLYGDHSLAQGNGSVVGYDLMKLKRKQVPLLRRKIGMVFQDFQLLPDRNIYDNLLFVLKATGWKDKAKIREQIESSLEKVNVATKGYKMPHQLSGGEQQRVAIARALLNNPELILADEPTGNLDPETTDGIMELLFDLSRNGQAVLMATHDYRILELFPSRIIKCESETTIEMQRSIG